MSVEAISWALRQVAPNASSKHLLTVLANCADPATFCCWPSVTYLEEATQQNRKTVFANLKRLKAAGLIADTGERRGATGQVIVYQINADNRTESGTVPKQDANRTEIGTLSGAKESQKVPETVPKTGHGNERNKIGISAIALPDFLTPALWQAWVDHRRAIKKPLNDYTAQLALNRLVKLVALGNDPVKLVDEAISGCWQSFYPSAGTKTTRTAIPAHRREVVL